MLTGETLVLLGGVAVLPYLGEALWSWLRGRCRHRRGALLCKRAPTGNG